MYRTHHCGQLAMPDVGKNVSLCGWVQKCRDKGFVIWVDLRDRYGITQLVFDEQRTPKAVFDLAKTLGREFVIKATGRVIERESKNLNISTGGIELLVEQLELISSAKTPPFTIEQNTDGGEDLRMKYRYLDIRREPLKNNLIFRHKLAMEVRKYLSDRDFLEIETPYLIKSTPEGARDFVVPSRMNLGSFYALPQSPQTFKQLLMVAGMDRYFQIVRCFRDEDLRADRQPEFTQIDCEMAFVTQPEVMAVFEGLVTHLIKTLKGVDVGKFTVITYEHAIRTYGNDKPDIRFGMPFVELTELAKNKGFQVFDESELVVGINVERAATFTRKQIDDLVAWVKQPQIGASGLVWVKYEADGALKSSVDKFYTQNDLQQWAKIFGANPGDLMLIMAGNAKKTRTALSGLRMELAKRLELRDGNTFAPLWVVDFPLLEWDEEHQRFHAMHHPFTSPKEEDIHLLKTSPELVRANAYDMVINGNEVGGGSIRIIDKDLQAEMFSRLGFSQQEAEKQFGFLMNAFLYGAPPHGGIAFGLDRLVAILAGQETIRDFIAFPKNNMGKDIMIDAPAPIDKSQLDELSISLNKKV